MAKAAVLAEGALGSQLGKTANGLVLHCVRDELVAVIDSTKVGQDAGEVVNDVARGIPVVADLQACIDAGAERFYLGVANVGGKLPEAWRPIIIGALEAGMEVVNGLHQFLADDEAFQQAAKRGGSMRDVRRPPTDLRCADGSVRERATPRILVMGQDCDIGKRITALQLLGAADRAGVDVGFVATGQTGCMLGAHAGSVIDRIPADFASGQVEKMVCHVSDAGHDAVLIYGQASLFHPSYGGVSLAVLQGAAPHAVVLQIAPGRTERALCPGMTLAPLADEIHAIELLGGAPVVALAMNPTECDDPAAEARRLGGETGLPVIDPLGGDVAALWSHVWKHVAPAQPLKSKS